LQYINDKIVDVKAALDGVRDIVAEMMAENADLLGKLRDFMRAHAVIHARVIEGKQEQAAKFADYFDHQEPIAKVPSHRALAMLRGRNEEFLTLDIEVGEETGVPAPILNLIAQNYQMGAALPGDVFLRNIAGWAWRVKCHGLIIPDSFMLS